MKRFLWRITGSGLLDKEIPAAGFDEAIGIARRENPGYTTGQVIRTLPESEQRKACEDVEMARRQEDDRSK